MRRCYPVSWCYWEGQLGLRVFNILGEIPCLLESLSILFYLWVWEGAGGTRDPVMGLPVHSAPQSGQKPCVADCCFSNIITRRLLDLPYGMIFLALWCFLVMWTLKKVFHFPLRCVMDDDNEVRDRATFYLNVLEQKQKALNAGYILNGTAGRP